MQQHARALLIVEAAAASSCAEKAEVGLLMMSTREHCRMQFRNAGGPQHQYHLVRPEWARAFPVNNGTFRPPSSVAAGRPACLHTPVRLVVPVPATHTQCTAPPQPTGCLEPGHVE